MISILIIDAMGADAVTDAAAVTESADGVLQMADSGPAAGL